MQFCNYADLLPHDGQYNRAIKIGLFMVDEFQGLQESDEELNDIIIETIGVLVKNFMKLYEMPISSNRVELSFANLITTLEFTMIA
jgi:hypothetical protein